MKFDKAALIDGVSDVRSELERIDKAIPDFGKTRVDDLQDFIDGIKRDLKDAMTALDALEGAIDKTDEEESQ
jgi:hypothetical protein